METFILKIDKLILSTTKNFQSHQRMLHVFISSDHPQALHT